MASKNPIRNRGMQEHEYQFVRRFEELRMLVTSSDDFDILKISSNLRLLLLDGLLHRANRRFGKKIEFTICASYPPDDPSLVFWTTQDGLYPPTSINPKAQTKQCLDGFLAIPVMKINACLITVKDVIKFEANIKGGVHVGKPKQNKPKELALNKWHNLWIGGYRSSLRQLKAIGLVTLEALKPYDAIKQMDQK